MRKLGAVILMLLLAAAVWAAEGAQSEEQPPSAPPVEAADKPAAEGIHWLHDIGEAMQLSAKDGRPVITYFTYDT